MRFSDAIRDYIAYAIRYREVLGKMGVEGSCRTTPRTTTLTKLEALRSQTGTTASVSDWCRSVRRYLTVAEELEGGTRATQALARRGSLRAIATDRMATFQLIEEDASNANPEVAAKWFRHPVCKGSGGGDGGEKGDETKIE